MKNKLPEGWKTKPVKEFETQFIEVVEIINSARINALKSVNAELISLYWKIGEYIGRKLERSEWGESVVSQLATYIQKKYPEFKGYSDKNLWRMKQIYETYCNDEKLSPLVRQLSWTYYFSMFISTFQQFVGQLSLEYNATKMVLYYEE